MPESQASSPVPAAEPSEAPVVLREPADSHSSPAATADTLGQADVPASTLPSRVGRYEVVEEIAHGGMGAVFKVRDPDLGRTLAMKVLLDQHGQRPDLARRFLEEAQIGGQLQHPGLVPVHELGRLPDQRPFFTMKLVKGRTLAELLKERASPADDLPRLLGIFEQVCQTVAYTHSRGVIHRDLKPANVMVGAFGEVQVMDWGLAKLLGQETPAAATVGAAGASTIYSSRSSSEEDSATRAGTVLGTPAYMPPEQARGQVEHLDERCDVFGLGAILCEILTGQPPYVGQREQVLALATEGNLTDARARLEGCGADAELVKLALQCLAFQPLERPGDATAVAEGVVAYRAGVEQRVRQAELERAAAQTRAVEERKRRRLAVLLAAVVVVALGAGGGLWLWQKQKRLALEHDAVAALEKAELLQQEGKWADALAQARQAEGLLPAIGDRPELRRRIDDRIAEIEMVQRFEQIRTPSGDTAQRLSARHLADAAYAKAFRELDIDVDALEDADAAERILARPRLKLVLVAALDDWVVPRKQAKPDNPAGWKRLLAVARAADRNPWRDDLRAAMASDNLPALKRMAKTPDLAAPVATLQMLADWLIHVDELETAIGLLRRVQWQHPDDFWVTFKLGSATSTLNDSRFDLEEPLRCYATAVALRPGSARAWDQYGVVLRMANRLDDAIAAHERASQLLPDNPWPYLNLARCLSLKADLDRMGQMVDLALELTRKAAAHNPKDYDNWAAMRLGFGLKRDVFRHFSLNTNA